ncbi:MAG: HEAT repeat domain-containing protein [Myxococcota bacterium]|nr:HEAT repeat domain-containing protein [Myxococcota bacterium]
MGTRSVPDQTALLVELLRLIKGRSFYPESDAKVRELSARAIRALSTDLERHGEWTLEPAEGVLFCGPAQPRVCLHSDHARELSRRLADRGVLELRFESGLDEDGLASLTHVLCREPDQLDAEGGPAAALAAGGGSGVHLELLETAEPDETPVLLESQMPSVVVIREPSGEDTEPLDGLPPSEGTFLELDEALARPEPSDFAVSGRSLPPVSDEPRPGTPQAPVTEPDETTLSAPAEDTQPTAVTAVTAITAPADAPERIEPLPADADDDTLATTDADPLAAPAPLGVANEDDDTTEDDLIVDALVDGAALGDAARGAVVSEERELDLEPLSADGDLEPGAREDLFAAPLETVPADYGAVEAAPLERGIRDGRSAELVDVLRELDACEGDAEYADLARRAFNLAERCQHEGRDDDTYRVMLVFSDHAADIAKRGEQASRVATQFLTALAAEQGRTLLIERACAPSNAKGVRASRILLQLGSEAAADLLRAAETEPDDERRAQLLGILIALGEHALPELLTALDGEEPGRLRLAARIVGDIQSPDAVPKLAALLERPEQVVREEAAKSLVRVGSPRAIDALIRSLRSRTPGMAALAVYCLSATGNPKAVGPLVATLEDAVRGGRIEVAREVVRALGRLGRAEATAPLAALLTKRSLFGGKKLRELKLAAIQALGNLPGDEAVGTLAEAASSRDSQIAKAAQGFLGRKKKGRSGS